ncbi:MAG: helix-turn-helix domain-containing protein [Actinobacteria bacterium]|nr:helix-turn-helix domain-containing protein [Actinomycetota bacterium]
MDGAEALRSARRRAGCSQRELAALAGVSASTVAAVESGARTASLATLTALLAAVGLELTVDVRVPSADPELRAHLRKAMPTRLHLALGGNGNILTSPPRGWRQLVRLSSYGPVSLSGPLAAGVWLPGLAVPEVIAVTFRHLQPMPLPDTSELHVAQVDAQEIASVHTGIGMAGASGCPARLSWRWTRPVPPTGSACGPPPASCTTSRPGISPAAESPRIATPSMISKPRGSFTPSGGDACPSRVPGIGVRGGCRIKPACTPGCARSAFPGE